ncbi:DedA family protein [Vibrio sp. V27_P1S3P104]|uniref:DedA family protein n=1 Tax=unclassified Vibrio TaxID=2614977 RepID=UPI0013727D71|nr:MULTISPECIES: DedA family protein [unclassified Vibrio]NAW68765.1 DedA family protein [Vibrio sp. V28_P6S34P95]NAX03672.1 DedA family protein [Vibrio sp. V30_P3S12P165]NAX35021.1 DedA family protein [Vibrio sp. V29_P1S30P107]NAX36361.1 DedA family protein [Vibrio sp. V27_P1S3P104]NAX41798.1 DedA family protein [Vibrio sp. V26_P1S5P106]
MSALLSIFSALWHQDLLALQQADLSLLYLCLGLLIFVESAFIPAAALPCDSVMILCGSLAALGILNLYMVIGVLVLAGWLGSIAAFYQGYHLKESRIVSVWLEKVSDKQWQTTDRLIQKYGLLAMFFARFIPVVRSLLPMVMGLRNTILPTRFLLTSPSSALIWILCLIFSGYGISLLPEHLSKIVNQLLMLAPLATLFIALSSIALGGWIRRRANHKHKIAKIKRVKE